MPDRPELPTFFQRRSATYNVLPDDAPMTWGIWDLEGWLGEITLADGSWQWRHHRESPLSRPHASWQAAVAELLTELPGLTFD